MNTARKRTRPLHRLEGIIVKAIDYQEYDKLLHVFTKKEGMCALMAKRANHPKTRGVLPCSPLTHAEFVFENPEKALPICREISPISHNLDLRKDIDRLNDACKMASVLHATLMPGKGVPLLFDLFKCYLDQLTKSEGSPPIVSSFILKLLRHEGVFTLPLHCMECQEQLDAFSACDCGFFCSRHAPDKTLSFSGEEQQILYLLMYSRQLSSIVEAPVNELFVRKVEALYKKIQFQS
ncbi:MAG: DNA repair protein RecO [Chlamydiota bacterium]